MLDNPADIWTRFYELKAVNPVAAANFLVVNRLHDVPRPATPETKPATETNPALAEHREFANTNPVLAARHALASGLFQK